VVARKAHNLEVVCSIHTSATIFEHFLVSYKSTHLFISFFFFPMRALALSLVLVSVLSACTMPGSKTPTTETSTGMVETSTSATVEVTPVTESTVSAEVTATAATVETSTSAVMVTTPEATVSVSATGVEVMAQ